LNHQKNSLTGTYVQLHFIVMIWGFTAILGMLISLPPVEVVLYRTLFSFLGLYLLLRIRGTNLLVQKSTLLKLFGTGSVIALHWILFFLAARLSNISICLVGMATSSLWTSILEPIITKKKFRIYEPLLGIIAIIGISVVFNSVMDRWVGFLVAVISALMASIFTIINGKFVKDFDHYAINFYEMVGAFLSILIFLPFYYYYFAVDGLQLILDFSDTFYLLVLALICTVYAYSISIKLMHKLTAFTINLTVNLEPVYGIILAVIIFQDKEKMEENFYLGSAIILLSVLIQPFLNKWLRKKDSKKLTIEL
jgi:drug/metabolite transporter (DMT)-like permease